MNPPTIHTLAETTAMLRGVTVSPTLVQAFPVDSLEAWRLTGLSAAPGHLALDTDVAWETVVRSWWSLGLTWGLVACNKNDELEWNLALPRERPESRETANAHLTGARWENSGDFKSLAARMSRLPFRAAMTGHFATGPEARPEPALRSLLGKDFILMVVAKACTRAEIEAEIRKGDSQKQFLRDEYLARPGLERDSHSGAAECLELVEAARLRATEALREGGWLVRTILAASDEPTFRQAQSLLHGAFAADGGQPEPLRWQALESPRKLTFLRTAEAAALARPPRREMPGFGLDTRLVGSLHGTDGAENVVFSNSTPALDGSPSLPIGRVIDDSGQPGQWLEIPLHDLCRHVLVAGMTGSGKGVTCEHLLLELWREHRIPWLVVEPGLKTGYRRLLNSEIGEELEVWSVGDPRSRRLTLNPMAVPPGVGLAEHTSALFALISSAFELVAPMPEVLANAIEETYRRHGWDLTGEVPDAAPPTLADLVAQIDRSTRELGYGTEISGNIRAGLLLRLSRLLRGPLAPELGAATGLNMGEFARQPVVVELSRLPDAESQALIMGLIALQLRHHWRLAGSCDHLRHVVVLEEAHRLLKTVPETAANAARVRATEDLSHLLAEMRGLGVGLIVVDQTPSALVPSTIANTGTKILHRLDHPDDRELAGRSAGLPADQIDLLGSLRVGETILRTCLRPRPFRLRMPNPAITYGGLPLPELPPAPLAIPEQEPCPGCGEPDCPARVEGAQARLLPQRLAAMEGAAANGKVALREWARREVGQTCPEPRRSTNPLCFSLSLGVAAGLSGRTLAKIREAFAS